MAIFPILAKEDMVSLRSDGTLPDHPVAFVDYDPSQGSPAAPGSEASIANLVREIGRPFTREQVVKQRAGRPITIEVLRETRTRTLIFVTDYVGSGKQVLDYIDTWFRNPSIRSWRSYGLIRIYIVAYAATAKGRDRIRAASKGSELSVVEVAPTVFDPAQWQEDDRMVELCKIYAARCRLWKPPLGFGNTGGLFASALSVPNNLPAILWESSAGRWAAFFVGRTMPAEMANTIGDFMPQRDIAHELRLARARRLAARYSLGQVSPRWAPFLTVLALSPGDDDSISERTGKPLPEVREIRATLLVLGLLDLDGDLTEFGRRAIARSGFRLRVVTAGLQGQDSPYYPRLTR